MTRLLEQAITLVRDLSDSEQDAIAQLVLDEIASDERWDELLARSPEKLKAMADKAWAEHEAGGSEPLHPDRL